MTSDNKQIVDTNSFKVSVHEGKQTAFAETLDGFRLGYQLSSQGELVPIKDELFRRPECQSWLAFRKWAKENLDNPVLEKGCRYTVKKVPSKTFSPSAAELAAKPWMKEGAALAHARQSDPHDAG